MNYIMVCFVVLFLGNCPVNADGINNHKDSFALDTGKKKGVEVLRGFHGIPDSSGVVGSYKLKLPAFSRGCYYTGDNSVPWPDDMNATLPWIIKGNFNGVREGGIFTVLKLEKGGYLAIVPVTGSKTMAWLACDKSGSLNVKLGTLGIADVSCDAPLFAWASSDNVYDSCREAWEEALNCAAVKGSAFMRSEKTYPEVFRYLGWCSWEEYKMDISAKLLAEAVTKLDNCGIPFRFMLVDDGHLYHSEYKIKSFAPDPVKFPDGWAELLAMRNPDKIKWMGIWDCFNAYWKTVHPQNFFPQEIKDNLMNLKDGFILPKDNPESIKLFYDSFIGSIAGNGFDFVKIDSQSRNVLYYKGTANAVETAGNSTRALESAANSMMKGLLNCQAHNGVCFFNARYSAVSRSSNDYRKGDIRSAKAQLRQSFGNSLWLCQTMWSDYDMFHSGDSDAGFIMAVSKAVSGGPVYLSDSPDKLVPENIMPLCYENGELIRPLAPAAPLPSSMFTNPMAEPEIYKVIAPLQGDAAVLACFNLFDSESPKALKSSISVSEYTSAGGMIQPYKGKWKVPDEGLVLYDFDNVKAVKLKKDYKFELSGFSCGLFYLCPVKKGWAVIGRTDKFLSPAVVEIESVSKKSIQLKMTESGPLVLWCENGVPSADGATFKSLGDNLFRADIEKGKRDLILAVTVK